jgi:putative endopeptidase
MRRSIAVVILLASAASAVTWAQTAPTAGQAASETSVSTDAQRFGTFGFDTTGMDRSVQPGDDFYDYANGTWAKNTSIPADKSSYGAFDLLSDLSQARTRGILDEQARDRNSKIGTAYATYLDTAGIEAKGLAPIQPWLGKVKGLTRANYASLIAEANSHGIRGPFGSGVGQDDKLPEVYALNLSQSGLGLPDRDYYLKTDPKLVEARTAYQAHLAKLLTLAGEPNAAARAAAIVQFETQIAQVSWTRVDSRDATKTYNKMSVADLQKMAPGFDFVTYFKGIGAPVNSVIVAQPTAVAGIAKLIAAAPEGVLRDQLMTRSLDGYADVLPKAFDDERFAFFGTALTGTPQQQARWKRSVQFTSGALSDEVSKLYVARYFPPETKAVADQMVKNILSAMNARIDKLTWMAPETKAKAHQKLAAFTPKIGYPSRWKDYSNLQIKAGDAFGNKWRAAEWNQAEDVWHLGKPLQRWEWGMTPMTVNAYANFGMVEIVFPAAILQPPFFDPKADPAVNYGGIGAVIGHEISHHFDDQGAKYNNKGELTDWWTPADVERFTALEQKLVQQYNQYEPLPGQKLNGQLTLGENSADLAGLAAAHDAYLVSLGGKQPAVIDGLTGDQRFYLGWAQVWRRNYREQALRQQLLTDPHSPGEQRTNIVRNMDPWYAAFKPQPGQKLYLTPEQRVRVW